MIENALAVVRQQFVTNRAPMAACLKEAIFEGPFYGQVPRGHHAEWVMEKMTRTAPAIPFTCVVPQDGTFAIAFWNGLHVSIPPRAFSAVSPAVLAATIAHEIAHMHGFPHSMDNALERNISIPYQVGACSEQISEGKNPPRPLQWSNFGLSDFKDEVALQPVGHRAGIAAYTLAADRDFETICPSLMFARGIEGLVSNRVQGIGMSCGHVDVGSAPETSPTSGDDSGAGGFAQHCYFGEMLVGLWGEASEEVSSMGPICAPTFEVRNRQQNTLWYDPTWGTENGTDPTWIRTCPAGMAVRALKGHFGVAESGNARDINSIQVVCQSVDNPRSLATPGMHLGTPSDKGWTSEACAGRGALGGLITIADDEGVSRIAGICNNYTGNSSTLTNTNTYHLPGIGAGGVTREPGHSEGTDWCTAGEAMVGVEVNVNWSTPKKIRGIRALCANASQAASLPDTETVRVLETRGPSDGSWIRLGCGNTELLSGLRAKAEWHLEDIAVQCRSFL